MNKTLLIAGIFVVLAVVLGCISYGGQSVPKPSAEETACVGSSGTVTTASCCGSASDFPNTCLIGACGCSPSNSHGVKTCDCGTDRCFNGTGCVTIPGRGLGNSTPGSAGASAKFDITVYNFQFNPVAPNITTGTTVIWTNNDTVPHSIVAYDGSFNSGALQPGESFSYTFTNAGLVAYHCGIHASMKGTINVQGEAPPQGAM